MTGTELAALIRFYTKTTTTTFTDADMLVLVNLFIKEMSSKISAVRTEEFNVEDFDDLVDDTRTYAFQSDVMNNLIRLELEFSSTDDYVLATFIKEKDANIAFQESIIVNYFSNESPKVFIRGKYIYILSGTITDVTDGIKWVYKKFPTALANLSGSTDLSIWATATSPGFPKEFHELLARRVSIAYKDTNNIGLSVMENNFEIDFQRAIDNYKMPVLGEQIIGNLPSGANVGDDGFDY